MRDNHSFLIHSKSVQSIIVHMKILWMYEGKVIYKLDLMDSVDLDPQFYFALILHANVKNFVYSIISIGEDLSIFNLSSNWR